MHERNLPLFLVNELSQQTPEPERMFTAPMIDVRLKYSSSGRFALVFRVKEKLM